MKTKVTIQHTYTINHETQAALDDAIAEIIRSPRRELIRSADYSFSYRVCEGSGRAVDDSRPWAGKFGPEHEALVEVIHRLSDALGEVERLRSNLNEIIAVTESAGRPQAQITEIHTFAFKALNSSSNDQS